MLFVPSEIQSTLGEAAHERHRVLLGLQPRTLGANLVHRQTTEIGHRHPPDTGGSTATSSCALTGNSGPAFSPFTQTLHDSSTVAKPGPNFCTAIDNTSSTVDASITSRDVPAASRAEANSLS